MVVETTSVATRVDAEVEWARAGLTVVDSSQGRQVIAFSDDPQLTAFLERLGNYGEGDRPGRQTAYLEGFFDSVVQVRPYGPQDRVGPGLQEHLDASDAGEPIFVDVELWYPGTSHEAGAWLDVVAAGITAADGLVVDRFLSPAAGVALLRAHALPTVVRDLLDVDLVASIDLLSTVSAPIGTPQSLAVEDIGAIVPAAGDAPVVGLVDSGVQALHPVLVGSIIDATSVSPHLDGGGDGHGHGTAVASLLVHGSLEAAVGLEAWPPPLCAVLSVRVLNESLTVPVTTLTESELDRALRHLARSGVRVVNLSLGDTESVFAGGRAPRLAALLDGLARELGLVLVVPTGRIAPARYYAPFDGALPTEYAARLAASDHSGLHDPGPAAIALTVGATVPPARTLPLGLTQVGQPGWPAPFSPRGPGIAGAVKPDFAAPGGTLAQETASGFGLQVHEACSILVADGRPNASGIFTTDIGASLAAPLVARVVAAVEGRYPTASANLLRALALQSAEPPDLVLPNDDVLSDGDRVKRHRSLVGFGMPNLSLALATQPRHVVLVAESVIAVDDVHLYAIPIPSAFFERGRHERGITIALAYDPPVRARRLDYLGSRMQFDLIRGLDPQQVFDLFVADQPDDEATDPSTAAVEHPGQPQDYERVSDLPSSRRPDLQPSRSARSLGTNQRATKVWRSALSQPDLGQEFLLVVQNVNRWQPDDARQSYALAIRLWVEDELPEIRTEIRQRVDDLRARTRARISLRT